jgi:hypothetical protein
MDFTMLSFLVHIICLFQNIFGLVLLFVKFKKKEVKNIHIDGSIDYLYLNKT